MDTFPDEDKRWFTHIGYLAQNWAGVEMQLDGYVRQLHVYYGGDKIEPDPPQAFNRKCRYLRKGFATHPDLVPYAEGMGGLLDEATKLSKVRHWALHSGLYWADDDPTKAVLTRYSRDEPLKSESETFTLQEIYDAAVECGTLMLTLTFTAKRFFGKMTKEDFEKYLRELTGKLGVPFPSDDPAG